MDKQQAAREAFEKWARASMKAGETNGLARKESGEYLWSGTSLCWDVWQAARSTLMPALVEARDALERTITHGYMQNEIWHETKQALATLNTLLKQGGERE